MAAPASAYKDRQFLAVIGDEVSLFCSVWPSFLLIDRAGLRYGIAVSRYWCMDSLINGQIMMALMLTLGQHVTAPPDAQKNFLVVDSKTDNAAIEEAFDRFTTERKDIGILLINQHVNIASNIINTVANQSPDC